MANIVPDPYPDSAMTVFVPLAMAAWIALTFAAFARLPPRRALILGLVAAWLFLPVAAYGIKGLPDLDKTAAACLGVLAAAAAFDFRRLARFRPAWADTPMAIWCAAPFLASLSNGFGVYDGLSGSTANVIAWGVPYLLGRVYFREAGDLRDLMLGIYLGGLAYVPFCLYEIVRGPELHRLLYGFHQHALEQASRFGGWRPVVFMHHGLMTGVWMASASVIGFHLAASGKRLLGLPPVCSLLPLAATCILLKSVNAWLLMATGLLLQRLTRRLGSGIAMWALGVLIVCYIAVRAAGFWSGGALVDAAAAVIGEDRARSLGFRFENESVLAQKARERPLLGWGGWGRHMVYDFEGNPLTVSDSLWIIAFGMYGSVGLAAVTGCLLAPVAVFLKRCRPRGRPGDERTLPAEALACVLLLYTVDHLVNAMVNPVFMLIAGGLAGIHCPADHPPACPEEASTHGTA